MKLDVKTAQEYLIILGYKVSKSNKFETCLRSFQIDNGINVTGLLDASTCQRLYSKAVRKVKKEPETMTHNGMVVIPYSVDAFKVSTVFHAVVIITDENNDQVNQCIAKLDSLLKGKSWFLTITHPGRAPMLNATSAKETNVIDYGQHWWSVGANEAFRQARIKNIPTTMYPIMARDMVCDDLVNRIWPLMETNNYLFVVADWYCNVSKSVCVARKDSVLWEQSPIGSVLFNVSLVPVVVMNTMPVLQHNADHATWMHWTMSGIKVNPINWTACNITRPRVEETESTLFRAQLFSGGKSPKYQR